jgi:predicted GH43/DUF377 family glycosyl hydrolase
LRPANRNCVVFPHKIGDDYAIYHRPSDRGHTPFGDIFYATSPDLVHWGRHRFVFGPAEGWQSLKVGPGPHRIWTDEGWLLIYHGVWRSCNGLGGAWKIESLRHAYDELVEPAMRAARNTQDAGWGRGEGKGEAD